jgi:hypothetical protein
MRARGRRASAVGYCCRRRHGGRARPQRSFCAAPERSTAASSASWAREPGCGARTRAKPSWARLTKTVRSRVRSRSARLPRHSSGGSRASRGSLSVTRPFQLLFRQRGLSSSLSSRARRFPSSKATLADQSFFSGVRALVEERNRDGISGVELWGTTHESTLRRRFRLKPGV